MHEWLKQVQIITDEIDRSIKHGDDEALTLRSLSQKLGYSEFHMTRKFKEVSGMQFRDYVRKRKLTFALKQIRDSDRSILDIACDHGFSSHEAFTRAFKKTYGVTPRVYRKNPQPLVLRTKVSFFDPYLLGLGEFDMIESTDGITAYYVTIPAHKFLHTRNYESNGYWDFWQKQNAIPGQDFDTVSGALDSIKDKLDDEGGSEANSSSGQIMGYIADPEGRLCDWGFRRIECFGVRLPADYEGEVPPNMHLSEVPEAEYLVFEHGSFDLEKENQIVEGKMEYAMSTYDFDSSGYSYDTSPGRILYFYHDPERFWKYIRPVKKSSE